MAEHFLAYDYPVIQSLLERIVRGSPLVRQAQIVRPDGQNVAEAGTPHPDLEPLVCTVAGPPDEEGHAGETLGTLKLGLSMDRAEKAAEVAIRDAILRSLALVTVLTLLLSLAAQRWLARPLRELHVQGTRLSEGDLDTEIVPVSKDEMGRLSSRLEEMRRRLLANRSGLEAKNEELERLDRMKSDFVATMSHEIRTPLNGILGFHAILLDTELTEEQRGMLLRASRAGDSLLGIINDVLDFSKIEAGRMEVDLVPVDLRMVLRDVVDLVEPGGAAKGIAVQSHVQKDFPQRTLTDGARVRQILLTSLSTQADSMHEKQAGQSRSDSHAAAGTH